MRQAWERLSVSTKFALILSLAILLAGLVTGGTIVHKSDTIHRSQQVETLSVAAKMLAVHLQEYMSRLLKEMQYLGNTLELCRPAGVKPFSGCSTGTG